MVDTDPGVPDRMLAAEGALAEIPKQLEKMYPGSSTGIILSRHERLNPTRERVVAVGDPDRLMFMGSLVKPAWVATALEVAESRHIGLEEPVIPMQMTPRFVENLYTVLFERPDLEKAEKDHTVDAFNRRVLAARAIPILESGKVIERKEDGGFRLTATALPSDVSTQANFLTTLLVLEGQKRAAKTAGKAVEEKAIANQIETFTAQNGKQFALGDALNLSQLAELTLGPSSTESLILLRQWFQNQLGGTYQEMVDFVQARTEQVIKQALGRKEAVWTLLGSSKAQNGTGNCATLREVFAYFQCIANKNAALGLSPEAFTLLHKAMDEVGEQTIQLKPVFAEDPRLQAGLGKYGYFPYIEPEDFPPFTEMYNLKRGELTWLMHLGSTERLDFFDGNTYDIAYSVAIPNNKEPEEFDGVKTQAAAVVRKGIAEVLT